MEMKGTTAPPISVVVVVVMFVTKRLPDTSLELVQTPLQPIGMIDIEIIFSPRLPTSLRLRPIAGIIQAIDLTGGEMCPVLEDWDAMQPPPLDSPDGEEDDKSRGCGCLYVLRRLFRRKGKSKTKNKIESNVIIVSKSSKIKKNKKEVSVEDDERVTRAIVHVDAVQEEDEEHHTEVKEKEEEVVADSSEGREKEVGGEVKAASTEGRTEARRRRRRRRQRKVQALPSEPERKPAVMEQAPRPPQAKAAPCKKGKDGPVTPSALPSVPERKPAVKEQAPRPPQARAAPRSKRRDGTEWQRAPNSVRCSWKEEVAEATVAVAPNMRRCIVGPGGATLREVHHRFAGVRVTVPPPKDTVTATVRVRGPQQQVAAAVTHLEGLLHEAEVVEARVSVVPHQRSHVVGHRGATVWELQQQFPGVSVAVPQAGDLESRCVLLRGPRSQVSGGEVFLKARLQAAHTNTRRHAHTSRRHAHAHTPARH